MSRVDDLRVEYEAGVEVAELEDELVALKRKPGDGQRLREVKDRLRELRCVYRLGREGFTITKSGELRAVTDATASPAVVRTTATVRKTG